MASKRVDIPTRTETIYTETFTIFYVSVTVGNIWLVGEGGVWTAVSGVGEVKGRGER